MGGAAQPSRAVVESSDKQRDGWTLWREIYGTIIGTLPFVIMLAVAWMNMSERLRVAEIEIVYLKELARDRAGELTSRLDRIANQIEALQRQVAAIGAK
jgi:hypothetical protein